MSFQQQIQDAEQQADQAVDDANQDAQQAERTAQKAERDAQQLMGGASGPINGSDRSTKKGSKTPDPVGALRFLVKADDCTIGRFAHCHGLSAEYEIEEYAEGGQNAFVHKLRGRMRYPNLVLSRGITHESGLMDWFLQTKKAGERGNISVSLLGPDGKPVRRWGFEGAFPVRWEGPVLNARSHTAATETLEIAHRGFVVQD
ncbi:MAG TPA: phage tail protein [Gaiellales bacterium]|nr:phage tail protein [Gaiellales bacterium]